MVSTEDLRALQIQIQQINATLQQTNIDLNKVNDNVVSLKQEYDTTTAEHRSNANVVNDNAKRLVTEETTRSIEQNNQTREDARTNLLKAEAAINEST